MDIRQELQVFAPADFPVQLEYDGMGGGIARRETIPTFSRPVSIEKEIPFSRAMIEDTRIRGCMEQALSRSEDEIQETTKILEEVVVQGTVREILTVALVYPNRLPSANDPGSNNAKLSSFAFDAYQALADHFGVRRWSDWCIVPYFRSDDDTQEFFQLGVFVAEDFDETVVE